MSLCLFYKNLTVLDFAYFDADQGVMGESYWVDVRLYGRQNSESMIFDFSEVKKAIKGHIDAICDHRFVVSWIRWSRAPHHNGASLKIMAKSKKSSFIKLPLRPFFCYQARGRSALSDWPFTYKIISCL